MKFHFDTLILRVLHSARTSHLASSLPPLEVSSKAAHPSLMAAPPADTRTRPASPLSLGEVRGDGDHLVSYNDVEACNLAVGKGGRVNLGDY
jgi:hypothetical protein